MQFARTFIANIYAFAFFCFSCSLLLTVSGSRAQIIDGYEPSGTDYGGMGLMQTRSARFSRDTGFEIARSYVFPYERFTVNIQMLPWMEGTFRYTSIENRSFEGNAIVRGTTFKDRAIDFKFRAWEESQWFPQIAVGFQDALGTGIFSGEYIVASKRWEDFDFSFGVGWGYTAGLGDRKNPLIDFSENFRSRSSSSRQGGAFTPGAWFSGENIGLFGGVEYATPVRGLTFKLEYDPHNYASEPVGNSLDSSSRYNVGLNYRPFDWVDIAFARERGEDYMMRVALRAFFDDKGLPKIDAPPDKLKIRKTTLKRPKVPKGKRPSDLHRLSAKIQPWFTERYRPSYTEDPTSKLSQALSEEGIHIESISWDRGNLAVRALSSNYDVRYIAQLALTYSDLPAIKITISTPEKTENFTSEELRKTSGVDHLFGQINRQGWIVEEVALEGSEMSVFVIPMPGLVAVSGINANLLLLPPEVDRLKLYNKINTVTGTGNKSKNYESSVATNSSSVETNRAFLNKKKLAEENREGSSSFANVALKTIDQLRDALTGGASFRSIFVKDQEINRWNNSVLAKVILEQLKSEKIKIRKILFEPPRVTIHVFRGRYRIIPKNIGRAVRIIAQNVSDDIELITVVLESPAGEVARITIQREQFERATIGVGSAQEIWHSAGIDGPQTRNKSGEIYNSALYPDFRYSIRPGLHQHIGGGDQFYLHQLFANISTKIAFFEGFNFDAAIGLDLYNNFNRITTPSDSVLPRVRSDIKHYLQRGHSTLRKLRANYMFSPAPDLYARLSAGYFEMMYGGFSGEILHRPFGARYAYGVDLNYVRKREFDQLWGFQDYSVLTGHLNAYYSLPMYGLQISTHAGQYLAGDRGVTQILARRFSSGIVSGVWASATNVPPQVFGEGSFDKGFFIVIPMDLFASRESLHHGTFAFRPLTKDGGQMLDIERLHGLVSFNPEIMSRDWKHILD